MFLFESSRPRYALYPPTQTYIGSTAEKRVNITSTRYQLPLSGGFLFPTGRDPRSAYYYLGFDGTYYYQATNGQLIGSLFGADAAFNHSLVLKSDNGIPATCRDTISCNSGLEFTHTL